MAIVAELERRIAEGANAANLAYLLLLLAMVFAPRIAVALRVPGAVGLVIAGTIVGPHGFGILAADAIALRALADVGLLYALFVAGLELDPQQLVRHARTSTALAVASFALPVLLGFAAARLLGYEAVAAAFLGLCWGSHTMVALPELRGLGLARNRAVATVVGATPATSILAVCLLAGLSHAPRDVGAFARGATMLVGLIALVAWSLLALPRLARRFFARVGSDTGQRFGFALAAMFLGAVLGEAAGFHGVVGAFLAGLGLSRAIPAASPLLERVVFVGAALFVPILLIAVGTQLDPAALLDPRTLAHAAVFTVIVLGSKLVAALLVGRRASFGRWEIGMMWGLTGSQVAVALATIAIATRLGAFDAFATGVVLAVMLATLVVAPAIARACGRALAAVGRAPELPPLGRTIVVAIRGASSRPLVALAGRLAEPDLGMVVAGSFAVESGDLEASRRLVADAESWLGREGLEGRSLFRVSRSAWAGVVQTVRAEAATLVLAEDTSEARGDAPVPVVLTRGDVEPFDRLVVVASGAAPGDLELAREVASRLAGGRPVVEPADPLAWLRARPRDLAVVAGFDALDELAPRFVAVRTTR